MLEGEYVIVNRLGLHARAAAVLVQTVGRFASEVKLEKDGVEVNGKSIMGVLMLAAPKDSRITVRVAGDDEAQAMSAIEALINDGFGEE
ncbi:MAG: HPr family phosphocarrier protein [Desulfuromonas sp.]|nr:MAG: HPr family phosphocarrier protein [Desulfuromonas sp.]